MNIACLTGYLPRDVEIRSTSSGKSVATFSLGVKRQYAADSTDYLTLVAWDKTAEYLGKYGKKGAFVEAQCTLRPTNYKNKDGITVYTVEIVVETARVHNNRSQTTETVSAASSVDTANLDDFEDVLSLDGVPF